MPAEPTQAQADAFMRLASGVDGPPVSTPGTWWSGTRAPTGGYTYRWRRSGFGPDIGTGATYIVQAADSGHSISCYSTAANSFGSAESLPSDPRTIP